MSTYLGLEFGSTRIKAVVTDGNSNILAIGAYSWENTLADGLWTYSEAEIYRGMQSCFTSLSEDYEKKQGAPLTSVTRLGFSGMMHGYLALNKNGELIVPFRTWRNTNAAEAAEQLTNLFGFNIPMRWSISHLYQCILDGDEHVKDIDYLTTLSGYIHYKLTGERVIGIGEASGMFPIDSKTLDYDETMVAKFDALIKEKNYPWRIRDILPKVLSAGDNAGMLTREGAALLDVSGRFKSGIPLCPPEGDAGTGMVATNSVRVRTGNVSAGTSGFAMVVLENMPVAFHPEIDMVTTPDGAPVAMVHSNTCTSDINAWAGLFGEFAKELGITLDTGALMEMLFKKSLGGDSDFGGLLSYNFLAGEPVVGCSKGTPMLMRRPDGKMTLANFFKAQIYSAVVTLAAGMDILRGENAEITEMCGHGGFFKTPEVGQRAMSAAMGCPVTVMENAGEGGAFGMALLASYDKEKSSLPDYLDAVFAKERKITVYATDADKRDMAAYLKAFRAGLPAEMAAAEVVL